MKKLIVSVECSLVISFFLFSGCAAWTAKSERMSLSFKDKQYTRVNKIISINSVETVATKAAADTILGTVDGSQLESTELRKALVDSITASGIFQRVVSNGQADYNLSVKSLLVDQRQNEYSDVISKVMIRYMLFDSKTQQLIWKEDIKSLAKVSIKEAYIGPKRFNGSLENAVKINLNQLVEKLSLYVLTPTDTVSGTDSVSIWNDNYVLTPGEKFSIAKSPITWSDPGGVIAIVPYEQIEFKTFKNRVIGIRKKSNDNNAPLSTEITCDCDLIKDSNEKNTTDVYLIQNERCRVYIVNGAIKVSKHGESKNARIIQGPIEEIEKHPKEIRIEQWATIEKLQVFIKNNQYAQIPSLYSMEYREYAKNKMNKDIEGFLKGLTVNPEMKERFINGQLPLRFKMEDGEWKIHER
ncbi:hypothetical protein DSCO28_63310 [Desulfosarcina ovata subsp. sediminis]|uniref:Lipoprotein n=1 Tax=Desulfosarcina ovata subsp. sediminis TaxID=885957 RepID=A0A5K7ZZP9_9BACT|nr:hypothetical protein [Desulfosarcina ovata]BBO85765.1 hypothetical protein DSCO28_63310 [Desulfosarcina ovata subsp. sediminis]